MAGRRETIRSCDVFARSLALTEPYSIHYQDVETVGLLFLRVELRRGLVGWGTAAPDADVTGETLPEAERALRAMAEELEGEDASRLALWNDRFEKAYPQAPSARAAVSIALHDLLGKRAGLPLYRLLGHYRNRVATSVTIGITDVRRTVALCRRRVREGFRILKLKGGRDRELDIERVRKVREAVGRRARLRFDANQGYSPEDALAFLREVSGSVELLEQPTHAEHLYALKEVTLRSPIPIMADESILTLKDSLRIATGEAADMVNLKLMKSGGLRAFQKANSVAEAASLEVMVGCMDESRVSIAAALALCLGLKNAEMADLDGHLDLVGDPARGGVTLRDGYLSPVEAPGLGVEVELE